MRTITGLDELKASEGEVLGTSDWHEVTQDAIDAFAVNYGLNRVRFPAPVPVGSRARATVKLAALEDIPGGAQITLELTFEVEGGEKPACVA